MTLKLSSSAFAHRGQIPDQYTRGGAPQLAAEFSRDTPVDPVGERLTWQSLVRSMRPYKGEPRSPTDQWHARE
jgi:hypothetical protein